MTFAYQVTLYDPTASAGSADPLLVKDLDAALSDWSSDISGLGTLQVSLDIGTSTFGRADGAPTSFVADGTLANGAIIAEPSSIYELTTGQHVAGAASDVTITIDPGFLRQLWLNPNPTEPAPVPGTLVDAVSVFLHELDHSFGEVGYYSNAGTLAYDGQFETKYDSYVRIDPSGLAWFTGPAAEAVYGGPVPLTSGSSAENYYHLANATSDPLGQDLMNGVAFQAGTSYDISNVDLAILQDVGVPLTSAAEQRLAAAEQTTVAQAQDVPVPCFAAGTRIATPSGEVPVEHLRVGRRLRTASGKAARIRWIGEARVNCRRHARPELVWPVRVLAGAFADGLPQRDLLLSPDHAIYAAGTLIPVKHLLNAASVVQLPCDTVRYFHIELDRHDVLLADGLPAESYLDTGNRAQFENGGAHAVLHPDFSPRGWENACAPLRLAGREVERLRARLLARLPALGFRPTENADLHVLAAGRAVRPSSVAGGLHRFLLPGTSRTARIVSRCGVPEHPSADRRQLGVSIGGIVVNGRAVNLDSDALGQGFHRLEGAGPLRWRWTMGSAELALRAANGPIILEIFVLETVAGWQKADPGAQRVSA